MAGAANEVASTLLWGLDPVFTACIPMLACSVSRLCPMPDLPGSMIWRGRPVRQVEVLGFVVALQQKERFVRFVVDDGTACLPCTLWLQSSTGTNRVSAASLASQHNAGFWHQVLLQDQGTRKPPPCLTVDRPQLAAFQRLDKSSPTTLGRPRSHTSKFVRVRGLCRAAGADSCRG